MVGGTPLTAAAVLQVEGEQAGEAAAASTSCQQGGDWLFKNGRSAASGDQVQVRLQCAHWIQIRPGVNGHLIDKRTMTTHLNKNNQLMLLKWREGVQTIYTHFYIIVINCIYRAQKDP